MTTEQLDASKRLFAAWRPRTAQELKAITIALPTAAAVGASARALSGHDVAATA